ncbi:MAG TPA: DUF1343 domain-containing protein [Vicinamibacteria bacterium]|nr:DUF1343 domain-containing protein [Vicinamibacteria bacterium]
MTLQLGLTRLLADPTLQAPLRGRRLGLVCHEASVDERCRHAADLLLDAQERLGARLTAVFSPQHGLWGQDQDNMIETPHSRWKGVPLFSLYSETRKPTAPMLAEVDTVLVDLQDIGTRIYTFAYTMSHVMEAAAELGKEVVILDRPNPIGGEAVQGTMLEPAYRSFVGLYPMPTRHGLTMGEMARWMNERHQLGQGRSCTLHVVPVGGWDRRAHWEDLGLIFVPPSPNIPVYESTLTFPGFVYFEGTNVSEGRGTTRPLEQCAAPYIEPERLIAHLDREYPAWHEGALVRPTGFTPTFQKHAGQLCLGVFVHPLDRRAFNPVRTGLALLRGIVALWPRGFAWKQPPYEYEHEKLPIDVIAGGTWVREWAEGRRPWKEYDEKERADCAAFREDRQPFLLY